MRGFTLIELLVVIIIVGLISVVALPTILPALNHRQVSEAARILQGALVGARDKAIHDGRPAGIRLVPDATFDGRNPSTGLIDPAYPLAYSRIVPIEPAPEYAEGAVTVRPGATYAASVTGGKPCLILEAAPLDKHGAPNPPTSWPWNIRVGDKVQLNNAGPWYTIAGPMAVGPAQGNTEMFANWGAPGTASPLGIDYLMLVDGRDDNGNGFVDEGWDGVDNNGNNLIDEYQPGVFDTVTMPWGQQVRVERVEWEAEAWQGAAASGMASVPYTIRRRALPGPNAREVALPTQIVIDAARSRLVADPLTGVVDLLIDPDGTAQPSIPYGTPAKLSMAAAFDHFALVSRADVYPPATNPLPDPKEDWSILTLNGRTGLISTTDNPPPSDPYSYAQRGGR